MDTASLLWPTIRARTLYIKPGFLLKIVKGGDSLSSRVFRSLAADDVESFKQCRFLKRFTAQITPLM